MTDAAIAFEFEHRLPAAYSQGFAHVRVVTTPVPEGEPLAASPVETAAYLGAPLPDGAPIIRRTGTASG